MRCALAKITAQALDSRAGGVGAEVRMYVKARRVHSRGLHGGVEGFPDELIARVT